MRRIHVLINCYWGNGMSGGDRRSIEMLRRWHNSEDFSFIIYTTHKFEKLLKKEGISKYIVEYIDREENEVNIIISYYKRMLKCFSLLMNNVNDGDIVYSSTDILPDVIPGYLVKKKNATIRWEITTYHIFEKFYKRPGNILTNFLSCQQQKLSIHLGIKKADKYFTTSPLVIDYLLGKKCDSDKIFLTDCAVDIDAIDKANCEMEQYDACFLARLNYSKGVLELPDIWEKVVETLPDAKLAIIGKGKPEFEAEIQNMISSKKLDRNIDMLGYLSSEKAWSLIKKSKCFLFTSHEEGWGMAVAEALTAGTPVVAYRLPIFEKLFPLGTRYCDFLNTDQMSEEVVNIISDNNLAERLGQEGSDFIRSHYTLEGMAQKELKLILE